MSSHDGTCGLLGRACSATGAAAGSRGIRLRADAVSRGSDRLRRRRCAGMADSGPSRGELGRRGARRRWQQGIGPRQRQCRRGSRPRRQAGVLPRAALRDGAPGRVWHHAPAATELDRLSPRASPSGGNTSGTARTTGWIGRSDSRSSRLSRRARVSVRLASANDQRAMPVGSVHSAPGRRYAPIDRPCAAQSVPPHVGRLDRVTANRPSTAVPNLDLAVRPRYCGGSRPHGLRR